MSIRVVYITIEFDSKDTRGLSRFERLLHYDAWIKIKPGKWVIDHAFPAEINFQREGFIREIKKNARKVARRFKINDFKVQVDITDDRPEMLREK